MADVREVGDWRTPRLPVFAQNPTTLALEPGDATTLAILTVVGPDGTSVANSVSTPNTGATWIGTAYQLALAGEYIERWTVTGKGAGRAEARVFVLPLTGASLPGQRVYATTTDYANVIRQAPDDDVDLRLALAVATREVEGMLLCSVYDTDSVTDLPTDTAVALAITEAVCLQAKWAIDQGSPYGGGDGGFQSMSAGGISLSRGSGGSAADPPGTWAPEAKARLRAAGLLGGAPATEFLWVG